LRGRAFYSMVFKSAMSAQDFSCFFTSKSLCRKVSIKFSEIRVDPASSKANQ